MIAFDWHWNTGWAGGVWGDIVASAFYAAVLFIAAVIFWPPLRQAMERLFHRMFNSHPIHDQIAELHTKLDALHTKHDALAEQIAPKPVRKATAAKKVAKK